MSLYARPSWKLIRQVTGDVLALAWCIGWWFTGRFADSVIRGLAEPARQTAGAAHGLRQNFLDAARAMEQVPMAGPALRQPFDSAAQGLGQIIDSAQQQVDALEQVATLTGWLAFLIPTLIVIAFWVPHRVRFALSSAAARRFIDAQPDLDLLALRALATQPFHRLAAISADPLGAWRSGDKAVVDALAELELRRNGWTHPALAGPSGQALEPPKPPSSPTEATPPDLPAPPGPATPPQLPAAPGLATAPKLPDPPELPSKSPMSPR